MNQKVDYRLIQVKRVNNVLEGLNHTHLPRLGKGGQGAGYKLDDRHCIKIYAKLEHSKREAQPDVNLKCIDHVSAFQKNLMDFLRVE